MDLADGAEDHVPVRAAEVGGRAKAGDGVRVAGVEDDVGRFGGGDLGGEILDSVSEGYEGRWRLTYGVNLDRV